MDRQISPAASCTSTTAHLDRQIESLSLLMEEMRADAYALKKKLFRMCCTLFGLVVVFIYIFVRYIKLLKH